LDGKVTKKNGMTLCVQAKNMFCFSFFLQLLTLCRPFKESENYLSTLLLNFLENFNATLGVVSRSPAKRRPSLDLVVAKQEVRRGAPPVSCVGNPTVSIHCSNFNVGFHFKS